MRKLTQEEAINNADNVHGDYYKYGKYHSAQERWNIWCPIHGSFKQRYTEHVNGECGCPKCKNETLKRCFEWKDSYFKKRAINIPNSNILKKLLRSILIYE